VRVKQLAASGDISRHGAQLKLHLFSGAVLLFPFSFLSASAALGGRIAGDGQERDRDSRGQSEDFRSSLLFDLPSPATAAA
jgi:hypothetical protein